MFDECSDDELMAVAGCNVKGSVSALVLTISLSSYKHTHNHTDTYTQAAMVHTMFTHVIQA